MWMVLSGRPRTELYFSGGGLGAGWGLCWTDCTVSMVSRYVCNMTKFKNNEQPGTILAPPRARPHRRRQPPYPVRSSVLSCTLVHPTAPHFPPPGIPKRCPSLHPRSHTCQGCTPSPSPSPRTAHQYRASGSPPALTSSVLTHRHDTANVNGTHVESRVK